MIKLTNRNCLGKRLKKRRTLCQEKIIKSKQCLVDNGIEEDEAGVVLQALCYILLGEEIEGV